MVSPYYAAGENPCKTCYLAMDAEAERDQNGGFIRALRPGKRHRRSGLAPTVGMGYLGRVAGPSRGPF